MSSGYDIKDLQIKLQVLSNGLIEERKKCQGYLAKIQDFENIIVSKDNEIMTVTKEKLDLESKLSVEKAENQQKKKDNTLSKVVNTFFNSENINFDQFDRIKEINKQLLRENKELRQKFVEIHESKDQQDIKYATMLTLQDKEIQKVEDSITKIKKENEQLKNENYNINSLISSFEKDKTANYDKEIEKLKKEKDDIETKITTLSIELQNFWNDTKKKQDKIKQMRDNYYSQTKELNKMSESGEKKKLQPIEFRLDKAEGTIPKVKILKLLEDQKTKEYVMKLCDEKGEDLCTVGLNAIRKKEFKPEKHRIEIQFGETVKKDSMKLTFDELLYDYFVCVYEEYESAANQEMNY